MTNTSRRSRDVETFQNEWELDQLIRVFDDLKPRHVLEVGSWMGGTLRYWLASASVVVIDDEMRNADEWRSWATAWGSELHLLHGYSQQQEIVEQARAHEPYDFVFIDGAHDYAHVSLDVANYLPMVEAGGLFVLHDIYERPEYGVWRCWQELTSQEGARYMEIKHNAVVGDNEGRCGIGILWQ